jgi:transcription elongation GreA/GreB family factor
MSPTAEEVERRIRQASRLSDLSAEARLDAKLDLSPAGVERRLREASDLLEACRALATLPAAL